MAKEVELTEYRLTTEKYISTLKKCIIVRDEQVQASQEIIRQKDIVTDEMKKIAEGEAKVADLQERSTGG